MASGISTSGVLFCFVPLALVIAGFITAAYFTNKQSTQTYVRVDPNTISDD